MSEITLKIINSGENTGTVGYLAKHAASIKLGNRKPLYEGDITRAAWLMDHEGKCITFLVDSVGSDIRMEQSFEHEWTTAAQEVIAELIDMAAELLANEDADTPRPVFALAKESA